MASKTLVKGISTRTLPESRADHLWLVNKLRQGEVESFTERVNVSPALAKAMLRHNTGNRKIRAAKVTQYADDMRNSRWAYNGETIIFAKNGELNDGQHRLEAVVASDTPQDFLIVFGVTRNSRFTVDGGAVRSVGEQVGLQGYKYPAVISASARMIIAFENASKKSLGRTNDVSAQEVMEFVNTSKLLNETGSWVGANQAKLRHYGRASVMAFLYYQFAQANPLKAKEFMTSLRDGTNLGERSPIRVAREKLMTGVKLTTPDRVEFFFRTWNYFINGREISQIRTNKILPELEGQ